MHQAIPDYPLQPWPVAFKSITMIPTDLNYFIHDKKLLAIVRALKEWELKLLSLQEPLAVATVCRALEYFMKEQKLNARQARWAEYLSWFDFRITYSPGCENWAAEALSRRSPSSDHDMVGNVTLLPHELFTSEALADLDAAVVAASGDETKDDDEENEAEEGRDPILELVAANKADKEQMAKLWELAKDGSPGYSVDDRGLLRISDKVYVPENPPNTRCPPHPPHTRTALHGTPRAQPYGSPALHTFPLEELGPKGGKVPEKLSGVL